MMIVSVFSSSHPFRLRFFIVHGFVKQLVVPVLVSSVARLIYYSTPVDTQPVTDVPEVKRLHRQLVTLQPFGQVGDDKVFLVQLNQSKVYIWRILCTFATVWQLMHRYEMALFLPQTKTTLWFSLF